MIEKEFISESTLQHKINIIFPYIIYKNNTYLENKINKLINNQFKEFYSVDIRNKKVLSDTIGEFTSEYVQTYKINNLLGVRFSNFIYTIHAAHGNHEIISLNINLSNGEEFEFKDLFRSYSKEKLINILKNNLLKKMEKNDFFNFDEITIRDNQDFYLSEDNIIICFFKYEIAAGCCGPIEVNIDINDLKDYINPNGPLSFFK